MAEFESLVSGFIERLVSDDERPRAALVSTDGVGRLKDGTAERLGSSAVVVVTNARVAFLTPDGTGSLEEWSVYYDEMESVAVDTDGTTGVDVTTCDGVRWRCPLPDADPEVVDAVRRHLDWVDEIRTRLLDLEAEVEDVADEIRDHADRMDWNAAEDCYQRARTRLDELVSMVQRTTPMADDTIAPELADIERTLEEGHVRLYIERARSQLELGRYLIENEEYDRAADVLQRAQRLHRQAAGQSDAVKRPDAFAFGRQREINEDLDRLDFELDAVAAEPLRQANEAAIEASETDDPTVAVEHWESAVARYNRILELGWWQKTPEADGVDDARAERDRAVQNLVATCREIATERQQTGVRRHEAGETDAAVECFETAAARLERAHELASEFDLSATEDIAGQLQEIRGRLEQFEAGFTRGAGDFDTVATGEADEVATGEGGDLPDTGEEQPDTDETDGIEEPQSAPAESGASLRVRHEQFADDDTSQEWIPPSMSDIVDIRTHHELTYDLDEIGLPEDVSGREKDGESKPGGNGGDN